MSIQGITPGLADSLRSSAEGRLLHGAVGPHVAADGHPIGFWLTVFPAAGIFISGWGSVLLRAVNRLCRDVAQPETRAAWLRNVAHGQTLRVHQRLAWWLWFTIKAGTWSDDALDLGGWIARGTFAGVTVGFLIYLLIG